MAQYDAMAHVLEDILSVRENARSLTDQDLVSAILRRVDAPTEATTMVKNLLAAEAVSRGLDADDPAIDFLPVIVACGEANHDVVAFLPDEMRERVMDNIVKGVSIPLEVIVANHGFELRLQPVAKASEDSLSERIERTVRRVFSPSDSESVEKAETYRPPNGARAAARRALKWIEDGEAGGGFTMTGRTRAAQLAGGESVSLETVKRMHSFFSRHAVDKDATGFSMGEKGYPSPGRVAWDAWGGDAGASWAARIAGNVEKADGEEYGDTPLSDRQKAMYSAYEMIESVYGEWDQSHGANGAHYMSENPFADTGMMCGNCVFYQAPGKCEIVEGQINPVGVCKLWIIPESLMSVDDQVEKFNQHHDKTGKFSSRSGGAALAHPHAGEGAAAAVRRLESGQTADIHPSEVGKAFDIMARGETHPDVTELHVDGTTIFGDDGLGYRRSDMPQIPTAKRVGFMDSLSKRGISTVEESVDPQALRPVQAEISGRSSGRMYQSFKETGVPDNKRIIISRDNYVIDGHHTWAAATALSFDKPGSTLPVYRINADHDTVLREAHAYADSIGSSRKDIEKFNPHHDRLGRFSSAGRAGGAGLGVKGRKGGTKKYPAIHFDKPYPGATGGHLAGIPTSISKEDSPVGEALDTSHSLWHHLEHNPHYDGSPGSQKYRITAERAALHHKLVHDTVTKVRPVKEGKEKVFVMLGGGPAAGKSTGLESGVFTDVPKNAVKINPDDVKTQLPEFDDLRFSRSDAEYKAAASFVHEESSMVAKMQLRAATDRGTHIVLDGTGDGSPTGLKAKVDGARSKGYTVRGRYATLETDTAWGRALERSKGREKRYVNESVVRSTHRDVTKTFEVAQKDGYFDDYQVIYTGVPRGTPPILVAHGTGGKNPKTDIIDNGELWVGFTAKGNEVV